MAYILLLDCMMAAHHDAEMLIIPCQLAINMPGSGLPFEESYADLFHPASAASNVEAATNEDALLLLTALLSDVLHVHRLMSSIIGTDVCELADLRNGPDLPPHCAPFVPFSPTMERARLVDRMDHALAAWNARYVALVAHETHALYYYTKMIAACPRMLELPAVAGYPPSGDQGQREADQLTHHIIVSSETQQLAYLVLAHTTVENAVRVEIWLPVIVFHAALAVWYGSRSDSRHPPRMLDPFTKVLDCLPWPCCREMVATLKSLQ